MVIWMKLYSKSYVIDSVQTPIITRTLYKTAKKPSTNSLTMISACLASASISMPYSVNLMIRLNMLISCLPLASLESTSALALCIPNLFSSS